MITDKVKEALYTFLQEQRTPDLLTAYFYYLEQKFDLHPMLFPAGKMIFASADQAIDALEKDNKLWHKTEIKIGLGPPAVNELTRKIYICPFTGRVFADNTHPNPQDAIYDWVSKCPENTERIGGVRAKRFFVSEDPEVIKNYIKPPKEPKTKTVYSSALTGKLFNSKEAVISDFRQHALKAMTLLEVQGQNRFELHEAFLSWLQTQLEEEKITAFVEDLAEHEEFHPYVSQWVEAEES